MLLYSGWSGAGAKRGWGRGRARADECCWRVSKWAKKQFSSSADVALRSAADTSQPLKLVMSCMSCQTSRELLDLLDRWDSIHIMWSTLALFTSFQVSLNGSEQGSVPWHEGSIAGSEVCADLAGHPGFLVRESADGFVHSKIPNAKLNIVQYHSC